MVLMGIDERYSFETFEGKLGQGPEYTMVLQKEHASAQDMPCGALLFLSL